MPAGAQVVRLRGACDGSARHPGTGGPRHPTKSTFSTPRARAGCSRACGPTHLLHCAWHTSPGTYWTSPENHRWFRRGVDLFESFYECGGIRAVGVGSCAKYGQPAAGACHETGTPLLPTTAYGSAKAALGAALKCHGVTFGKENPRRDYALSSANARS
ncbi:MAG: NAD-dependent epimerase/dehydratase family protein [Vulcanimicrobiaceae bacterium]